MPTLSLQESGQSGADVAILNLRAQTRRKALFDAGAGRCPNSLIGTAESTLCCALSRLVEGMHHPRGNDSVTVSTAHAACRAAS